MSARQRKQATPVGRVTIGDAAATHWLQAVRFRGDGPRSISISAYHASLRPHHVVAGELPGAT